MLYWIYFRSFSEALQFLHGYKPWLISDDWTSWLKLSRASQNLLSQCGCLMPRGIPCFIVSLIWSCSSCGLLILFKLSGNSADTSLPIHLLFTSSFQRFAPPIRQYINNFIDQAQVLCQYLVLKIRLGMIF